MEIFHVPNKFGFSGFPDKKHSVWNLPVHELSYLSNADLAMVSQLEGFESAPKAPEKLYFHVLLGVFTTKSGILENFIQKVDFIESRARARVRKLPMKREPDNQLLLP